VVGSRRESRAAHTNTSLALDRAYVGRGRSSYLFTAHVGSFTSFSVCGARHWMRTTEPVCWRIRSKLHGRPTSRGPNPHERLDRLDAFFSHLASRVTFNYVFERVKRYSSFRSKRPYPLGNGPVPYVPFIWWCADTETATRLSFVHHAVVHLELTSNDITSTRRLEYDARTSVLCLLKFDVHSAVRARRRSQRAPRSEFVGVDAIRYDVRRQCVNNTTKEARDQQTSKNNSGIICVRLRTVN